MAQHQHIAIQIRTGDPLALSIQKKLDQVPYQSTTVERQITIFRVPSHIRERNKNFFEPRMVSIGPYHRGREHLKCMEKEKLRYVQKMLSENPNMTLVDYLEVLRNLEYAARQCYYENIEMEPDEFVEMLLYDACFIIQLIVNWSFPEIDIISEISWNIPLIKSDLLLLENQITFVVLQHVFDLYSSTFVDASNLSSSSCDDSSTSTEIEKATLFDCLVVFLQPSRYQKEITAMTIELKVKLYRDYFSNPWSIIALIAAIYCGFALNFFANSVFCYGLLSKH